MNSLKNYENLYDQEEVYLYDDVEDYKLLRKVEGKRTRAHWEYLMEIIDESSAIQGMSNFFDRIDIDNCFYSRLDICRNRKYTRR